MKSLRDTKALHKPALARFASTLRCFRQVIALRTAPGLFSRLLGTIICHAFALVKFYLPILSIAIAHKLACNDFACVSSEVCSDLPLRKPLEFGLLLSASAVDVGQELGTHRCATLNVGYVSALYHRLQLRAMAMFFVALAVAKSSSILARPLRLREALHHLVHPNRSVWAQRYFCALMACIAPHANFSSKN